MSLLFPGGCSNHMSLLFYILLGWSLNSQTNVTPFSQEDGAILLRGAFSSHWVDVVRKGNGY